MNGYKILLVEDDTEISEMLKNYLTTENYDIIVLFLISEFYKKQKCRKFL